jgi:type IV pilus assembly protein PilV
MKPIRQQAGIMMLEAMLAIVLLAVGLVGAIGIQARSFSALSDATMRAEATMAGESLLGIMDNDQGSLNDYVLAEGGPVGARLKPWMDETRRLIPGATVKVEVTNTAGTFYNRVLIVISWQRKDGAGDKTNRHELTAHLSPARMVAP